MSKKLLLNQANLDTAQFTKRDGGEMPIGGVHITEKYTEATNGKCAIRLPLPDVDPEDFVTTPGEGVEGDIVLPVDILNSMKIPRKTHIPILQNACLSKNEDHYYLSTTDLGTMSTAKAAPIEGKFPEIDKVTPTRKPGYSITFNAKLLKEICSYVARHDSDYGKMKFSFYGETRAAKIDFETDQEQKGFFLLMPMYEK